MYNAFVDRDKVAAWLRPKNMVSHIHWFDARVGGGFGMSLTYQGPNHLPGKSSENQDTSEIRFVELTPCSRIVETAVFESNDAEFAGEMRMTFTFDEVEGDTEVVMLFENIPPGIRLEDNEQGCTESLERLAALLE